jgi:hypothetical protein
MEYSDIRINSAIDPILNIGSSAVRDFIPGPKVSDFYDFNGNINFIAAESLIRPYALYHNLRSSRKR